MVVIPPHNNGKKVKTGKSDADGASMEPAKLLAKYKGDEPALLDDDDLWKEYARADIQRRITSHETRVFSYSPKIRHDFSDPKKRRDLESLICRKDTTGQNLEKLDIAGNTVDMNRMHGHKNIWRISDLNDLSGNDVLHLMKRYNLKNKQDLLDKNMSEQDIDYLNNSLRAETKQFILFYANMMRVMHSLHERKSGAPFENHPISSFEYLFAEYENFFIPSEDALPLFREIDTAVNKKLALLKKTSGGIKGIKVPSIKRPEKKLCFESVILELMHDVAEEVADMCIPNWSHARGQPYTEWQMSQDPCGPQKQMAILYGIMAEAYTFVKENDDIEHKYFFYRAIKSITDGLSKLTKNPFDSYISGYSHEQVFYPNMASDHLKYPFDIPARNFLYNFLPEICGANDISRLISDMHTDVLGLNIPAFKHEKDKRGVIRAKIYDQMANSIDVAHFTLPKSIIAIFKAKTFSEFVLEFYSNKTSKEKKEFFYELLRGAVIQNDLNLHALYGSGKRYISSIFDSEEYKSDPSFKENIDNLFRDTTEVIVDYIQSDGFPALTQMKDSDEPNAHPWPDGWHFHMLARIIDKEYEIAKRVTEKDYRTNIEDLAVLYATLRYKQQHIREFGFVPRFPGHNYSEVKRQVDLHVNSFREVAF